MDGPDPNRPARAADDPVFFRQSVAKDTPFFIGLRLVDDRADGTACPDRDRDFPFANRIHTEVGKHAITCADDKRRLRVYTDLLGDFRITVRKDFCCWNKLR